MQAVIATVMIILSTGFGYGFFLAVQRLAFHTKDPVPNTKQYITLGCFGTLVLFGLLNVGVAIHLARFGFLGGSLVTLLSILAGVAFSRLFARFVYRTWTE